MSTPNPGPHFSLPSIIAVICAVLSFSHSGWAFFAAIAAIFFGVIGFLIALLPGVRGGIVSFVSIGAGLLGIVVAVVRLVAHAA